MKILDFKYCLRGEKFGSAILAMFSLTLLFLYIEIVEAEVHIYEIAK